MITFPGLPSLASHARPPAGARRLARRGALGLLVLFSVAGPAGANSLDLDRTSFRPGETIEVAFTVRGLASNAWAGIVPSAIPHGSEAENDRHDLAYRYLRGAAAGSLTFEAPRDPGRYDIRLHDTDSNGKEVASVSFVVAAPDASGARLSLDKARFIPGEPIRVRFVAPAGLADNAWVGIVPSSVRHGDEAENDRHDVAYQYLRQRTEGILEFTAPAASGAYDFRFHDTDANGREIAHVSFSVVAHVDVQAMTEQLTAHGRVPLYGIRFASGQATVGSESARALAEVGQLLIHDPSLRLRIEGHTDNQGSSSFNQTLSERRAAAVRTYLVETFGVDPSRLETAGFGDSRPMVSNDTDAGRAQNRRVELARL